MQKEEIVIRLKEISEGNIKSINGYNEENVKIHVVPQQKKLKIWLNLDKGQLNDTNMIAKDVSNKGHWGHCPNPPAGGRRTYCGRLSDSPAPSRCSDSRGLCDFSRCSVNAIMLYFHD